VLAALTLTLSAVAPTGVATAAPFALSTAVPPLAQIRESVDYLRSAFHVSQQEAIRRLVLQRDTPAIVARLEREFPNEYAGAWLDQEHGGTLMIAATDPATLTATVRALPSWTHAQLRPARFTIRQLNAVAAAAVQEYGPRVGVDEIDNRVVAYVPNTARAQASVRGALTTPLATGELAIAAAPAGYANDGCQPGVCTPPRTSGCDRINCTPPLRAGLNLDLWATAGGSFAGRCTSAFTMTGSNGWLYTSTAGHCLVTPPVAAVSSNNGHWLGQVGPVGYTNNVYPDDFAVMPFMVYGGTNYASYWLPGGQPHNLVVSGGDTGFPITGMYTQSQIQPGFVACASGETTGTTCGTVLGRDGGIFTDICQFEGDSGAPLFSQIDNMAYGLSSQDSTNGDSCPSGYKSYFTPLSNVVGTMSDGITISIATS
jgi:streptogrisin C